jgi:hypothetical protein
MNAKKLCWNCDGEVSVYAIQCPYCGTHLGTGQENKVVQSKEEPAPSYSPGPVGVDVGENNFTPLYPTHQSSLEDQAVTSPFPKSVAAEMPNQGTSSALREEVYGTETSNEALPFVLLLSGMIFLVFGLILFLFSTQGFLVLKWNASFWPMYLLLSVPLLVFGWRALDSIESE